MNTVVVYKSKYGSTKKYAEWIAEELKCDIFDMKNITVDFLLKYDVIIYGGGLYAEIINGLYIITKNFDKFKDNECYRYDLTEMMRQHVSTYAVLKYNEVLDAKSAGNRRRA